jgi:uncharacterized protein
LEDKLTSEQGVKSDDPKYKYKGGEIRLDREGRWFHEGVEITHELTLDLFNKSICKDPKGGYQLVIGLEYSPIVVEDTPFFVKSVDIEDDRALLKISDGTEEDLVPQTLRVGDDNVLYCDVKKCQMPARFFRPAYYQLMKNLEETKDGFAVKIGDKTWPIKMD